MTTELEFGEVVCAGQLVHASLPVAFLYVPGAQLIQLPPSGPKKPMLQVQLLDARHARHEAPELTGQAVHDAAPTAAHDA